MEQYLLLTNTYCSPIPIAHQYPWLTNTYCSGGDWSTTSLLIFFPEGNRYCNTYCNRYSSRRGGGEYVFHNRYCNTYCNRYCNRYSNIYLDWEGWSNTYCSPIFIAHQYLLLTNTRGPPIPIAPGGIGAQLIYLYFSGGQ